MNCVGRLPLEGVLGRLDPAPLEDEAVRPHPGREHPLDVLLVERRGLDDAVELATGSPKRSTRRAAKPPSATIAIANPDRRSPPLLPPCPSHPARSRTTRMDVCARRLPSRFGARARRRRDQLGTGEVPVGPVGGLRLVVVAKEACRRAEAAVVAGAPGRVAPVEPEQPLDVPRGSSVQDDSERLLKHPLLSLSALVDRPPPGGRGGPPPQLGEPERRSRSRGASLITRRIL